MELNDKLKKARIFAIQAAFNTKSTVYICKNYVLKYAHNYNGKHIEKAEYKNNKVTVYDSNNIKIAEQEGKKSEVKQPKSVQKLPRASDEKPS